MTGALAATSWTTWGIAAAATAGVIARPFAWPEWVWAVTGATLLVALGLLPPAAALAGVSKGADVYLFLAGMMLLAEIGRREGLFDWLATHAARAAQGSGVRLFTLVYGVGALVTAFLSNDATAVVLTPAVAAAARAAEAEDALPHLFACAFVANAASFVLPISNPANLVIYGSQMPPLLDWLQRYTVPSALSVGAIYLVLRWTQRAALRLPVSSEISRVALPPGGRVAAWGLAGTGAALLAASAFGLQLGWPTFLAGVATALLVLRSSATGWRGVLGGISWGVLPLVAGLFVLVEALDQTGATRALSGLLEALARRSAAEAAWVAGAAIGFGSNLVNNLPAGLVAASAVQGAHVPETVRAAVLVGVDLGPNLSVTGSLATILWLQALRREGHAVSAWRFLKLGALVMPPALALALAALALAP